MAAKLTPTAPAAKHDSGNRAELQRCIDQKTGHPIEPVIDSNNDPAQDSAEYIAVLAGQLQRIAETNGHEFLTYLIDMVIFEAWRIAGPEADHSEKNTNGIGGGQA